MDLFDIFGFATTAVIAMLTIAAALAFLHEPGREPTDLGAEHKEIAKTLER